MGKCNIIRSNLVGESINAQKLDEYSAWQIAGLLSRPIGSWYLSSESASPALLFGGTWIQVKDRFLVGAGNLYPVDSTGGEAKSPFQCASRSFGLQPNQGSYADRTIVRNPPVDGEAERDAQITNLPPYYATYTWYRVA